jgi:hypothetical protein
VEIKGHHYYNDPKNRRAGGQQHIRDTIIRNLQSKPIKLPGMNGVEQLFTPQELGIGYVLLVSDEIPYKEKIANPNAAPVEKPAGFAAGGDAPKKEVKEDPDNPPYFEATRYDFTLQFVWQEKTVRAREEERQKRAIEAAKAAAAAPPAAPNNNAAAPVAPAPNAVPPANATAPPNATVPAPMNNGVPMPPAAAPMGPAAAPMGPAAAPMGPVAAPMGAAPMGAAPMAPAAAPPAAVPPEAPPAAKGS